MWRIRLRGRREKVRKSRRRVKLGVDMLPKVCHLRLDVKFDTVATMGQNLEFSKFRRSDINVHLF
jgi:hypothetical protein